MNGPIGYGLTNYLLLFLCILLFGLATHWDWSIRVFGTVLSGHRTDSV